MLNNVKLLLGLSGVTDAGLIDLLNLIIDMTTQRLCNLIGETEVPDSLEHIIVEVSVIRYNRIGSEGISSHSVNGESMNFSENDFSNFMDEINEFIANKKDSEKRRVRFI